MTANDSHIAPECASHQNGGSASADGAPAAPAAGQRGSNDVGFEIEDDLWRAAALNDLAHWIGRAKHLIAGLVRAVDQDVAIRMGLASHGVGAYDGEWHDHHAAGLEVLHLTVDDHLRAVRQIAGIESRGSTAASTPETSTRPGTSAVGA